MKTVIDKIMNAVSKLKGDLDNVATPTHTDKYLYWCNESYFECLSFSDDISWELICTTEEFLATVAECKTNFGKCEQSYGEYKSEWEYVQEFKLKSKAVFTQEMADNGVLPSVGMECQTSTGVVTIAYKGNKLLIAIDDEGTEFQLSNKGALHALKPLTPPITLIDGKAYQFDYNEKKSIHCIYVESGNIFLSSMGSYCPDGDCTNIQPLTVEVK